MARLTLFVAVLITLCVFTYAAHTDKKGRLNARVVPSGTHFDVGNDTVSVTLPAGSSYTYARDLNYAKRVQEEERSGYSSGWVAAFWASGTNYNYFKADWVVPAAPNTVNSQILYIFNSLEPSSGYGILQPVLQWNGGISGWSLSVWYDDNTGVYHQSTPVAVVGGDVIKGVITTSGSNWVIQGYVNYILVTSFTVSFASTHSTMPTAQMVLEVYDISTCDNYPITEYLTFNYLAIQDSGTYVYPTWTVEDVATDCGQGATVWGTSTNAVPVISWST